MKLLNLVFLLLAMFCFMDLSAQKALDNDKIYVTANSPSQGVNTYQTNLLLVGFDQETSNHAQRSISYPSLMKNKWEAHADINSLEVDVANKIVTATMSSNVSHEKVLKLLHKINPQATAVVNN